jgi:hypothetical protein
MGTDGAGRTARRGVSLALLLTLACDCLRQAYDGGVPRGGSCVRSGDGLTPAGEPTMRLMP